MPKKSLVFSPNLVLMEKSQLSFQALHQLENTKLERETREGGNISPKKGGQNGEVTVHKMC